PEFWVVRDAEGRLNVEKLPPLPEAGLPAFSYHVEAVICHVWTPEARQTYTVEAIECRLEPRNALLDLSVIALSPTEGGREGSPAVRGMMVDTTLTVPRLRPELDLKFGGEVHIE